MQILIVEDEDLAVRKLQKMLSLIEPRLNIAGVTDSIVSTVAWLKSNPVPDLIFMDIELSDGQSFEIFRRVQIDSPVVFTTSYDESSIKAFDLGSKHYLLKPIQKDELENIVRKFFHPVSDT
ncbi:LytR/AlgR family response regulator transcription factor [Pollutibacter soli]|uniref:LytR/AlgR family response regulator transcription factor n=1 Tax=Pollutibacter soli TaxID=3034157 RepID=UPI0030139333